MQECGTKIKPVQIRGKGGPNFGCFVMTENIPLEISDFPRIFNLQKFGSYHGCNNLTNYIMADILWARFLSDKHLEVATKSSSSKNVIYTLVNIVYTFYPNVINTALIQQNNVCFNSVCRKLMVNALHGKLNALGIDF